MLFYRWEWGDLYIILYVLTSLCIYFRLMRWDYPGVVVIVSKMGVIVKVGGWVVLVGVNSQTGMVSSCDKVIDSPVRLLAIRIDSMGMEKCWAMFSSVSPDWTMYLTVSQSFCSVVVTVYCVDGVGISGTVPSGLCWDSQLPAAMDCQITNVKRINAKLINAVRVVKKMLVPLFEFTFSKITSIWRGRGWILHCLRMVWRKTDSVSFIVSA